MDQKLTFTYASAPQWFRNYCTEVLNLENTMAEWIVQTGPGVGQRTVSEFIEWFFGEHNIATYIDDSNRLWVTLPDTAETTKIILTHS